ncbi:MAG TPA: SBBP repeat-containing protein, partial [Bryobacterales bacterium]|nr:SBBP repeat-containing protein [Bryobacterales bacterium]
MKFLSRGRGYEIFLTSDGALLAPRAGKGLFGLRLLGADPHARIEGLEPLPGVSNYLIGADSAEWTTGVARYAKVRYEQVYPGVDLVYYGNEHELEHDFILAPGADPRRIRMRLEGAREIRKDANGDLLLDTSAGQVRQVKPAVYQEQGGERRQIAGRYLVHRGHEISFDVGPYDHARPLVIDPVTTYTYFSTYLGGSGDDQPLSIAVDAQGNAYVTGTTTSVDFPAKGPEQPASAGKTDVF